MAMLAAVGFFVQEVFGHPFQPDVAFDPLAINQLGSISKEYAALLVAGISFVEIKRARR